MNESDQLTTLIEGVKRKWAALGIPLRPGASDDQIREIERRFPARLPADFETWLRGLGGMEMDEWDNELIRFWKPDEVVLADTFWDPRESGDTDLLFFADWSISAHEYAVKPSDEAGSVWLVGGTTRMRVALSFVEFVRAYLGDPMELFREA